MPHKDPTRRAEYMKCYRETNKEYLAALNKKQYEGKKEDRKTYQKERYYSFIADGLCGICGKNKLHTKTRCVDCLDLAKQKLYALKVIVFEAYGGFCCRCCGETTEVFLAIDHVNNDGNEHRKQLGGLSGEKMYRWLIKNDFPEGFQVLCHNCNWAKHALGECPHQTGRDD